MISGTELGSDGPVLKRTEPREPAPSRAEHTFTFYFFIFSSFPHVPQPYFCFHPLHLVALWLRPSTVAGAPPLLPSFAVVVFVADAVAAVAAVLSFCFSLARFHHGGVSSFSLLLARSDTFTFIREGESPATSKNLAPPPPALDSSPFPCRAFLDLFDLFFLLLKTNLLGLLSVLKLVSFL